MKVDMKVDMKEGRRRRRWAGKGELGESEGEGGRSDELYGWYWMMGCLYAFDGSSRVYCIEKEGGWTV